MANYYAGNKTWADLSQDASIASAHAANKTVVRGNLLFSLQKFTR